MNDIELDKIVDYKAEYSSAIEKPKITGSRLTGLCPFHKDKKEDAAEKVKSAIESAQTIDLKRINEEIPTAISIRSWMGRGTSSSTAFAISDPSI